MFVVDARRNKRNSSWVLYIVTAAQSPSCRNFSGGTGMLAELHGKGLYVFIIWSEPVSDFHKRYHIPPKLPFLPNHCLEEQFVHKPSASENLLIAPCKVTLPTGLY